jgi:hypothetical protein
MTRLLPDDIRERLLVNGRLREQFQREGKCEPDFFPVVKLFTPTGGCTWLLTELDPDAPDIAFGLCDLGMGFPELGSVSIDEIESACFSLGVPVEIDLHFSPRLTISGYAAEARRHRAIKA